MKKSAKYTAAVLLLTASWGASSVPAAIISAPPAIIDDFNTPGLEEYSFSKILDQGTTTNVSYSDAGGTLDVSSTGADGAEQVLLLRGDVPFNVGSELLIDGPVSGMRSIQNHGIAIGAAHADLGNGNGGDNRGTADYAYITFRNPTQLSSRGFLGGSVIATHTQNLGVNADSLFIKRTGVTDVELGWYDGTTRNVAVSYGAGDGVTAGLFAKVGFYADLRSDGASITGLDNLRIVPEPSSIALVGFALASVLVSRWRKMPPELNSPPPEHIWKL